MNPLVLSLPCFCALLDCAGNHDSVGNFGSHAGCLKVIECSTSKNRVRQAGYAFHVNPKSVALVFATLLSVQHSHLLPHDLSVASNQRYCKMKPCLNATEFVQCCSQIMRSTMLSDDESWISQSICSMIRNTLVSLELANLPHLSTAIFTSHRNVLKERTEIFSSINESVDCKLSSNQRMRQ